MNLYLCFGTIHGFILMWILTRKYSPDTWCPMDHIKPSSSSQDFSCNAINIDGNLIRAPGKWQQESLQEITRWSPLPTWPLSAVLLGRLQLKAKIQTMDRGALIIRIRSEHRYVPNTWRQQVRKRCASYPYVLFMNFTAYSYEVQRLKRNTGKKSK